MKRDLYAQVSARIVAELEAGAAPWVRPWSATPGANTPCNAVSNRPYSGCNVVLLWMAQAAGYRAPRFLTFKQALELGGNVRKGERGTKVYFVKQLQVRDNDTDDSSSLRLIPMMREYTVFNVDQCENLPNSVTTGKPIRVRNPDTRDELADAFLQSTGADTRDLLHALWPWSWLPAARRIRDGCERWGMHLLLFAGTLSVALYIVTDMEYPRLGLIRIESFDHFLADAYDQMR